MESMMGGRPVTELARELSVMFQAALKDSVALSLDGNPAVVVEVEVVDDKAVEEEKVNGG